MAWKGGGSEMVRETKEISTVVMVVVAGVNEGALDHMGLKV